MSRSVSTPSGAAVIVFAHVESSYYCRTCSDGGEDETYADDYDTCERCKAAGRDARIEFDDDATQWNWDFYMGELRDRLTARYPSLSKSDRWAGREDRVILANYRADITVSEYCGLVAVCLVPADSDYVVPDIATHWCEQIEQGFRKVVAEVFGCTLRKIATASNGEAFFEQVQA